MDSFEHEYRRPSVHWYDDGRRFAYEQVDRGHQRLRVIEVDSRTGDSRDLIDERSETFIWTAHTENSGLRRVNWLEQSAEMIYISERDGWRHLYLVDVESGQMARVTQGDWVVRGVDLIDEGEAPGLVPGQRQELRVRTRTSSSSTASTSMAAGWWP